MIKPQHKWIAFLVLNILIVNLLILTAKAQSSSSTVVAIIPTVTTVAVGETFEIQVWVNDSPPLYGADIILSFDPTLLEVQDDNPIQDGVQIENGGFLQPGFVLYNYADNTNGIIRYANTQINPMPDAIGSGKLLVIHFKAKRVGTGTLSFTKAELANRNGGLVPVQTQSGSIQAILQKPQADLSIGIDAPVSVYIGENLSYVVTVDNAGPAVAEDVMVLIQFDPKVVYQRSGGLNWTCEYQEEPHQLRCNRDKIASGASAAPITIMVSAPLNPGEVIVDAEVGMTDAIEDPNLENNAISVSTMVTQLQADLVLEMIAPSSINVGTPFEYEARVVNLGPDDAQGLKFVFQLPPGVLFRSASGLGWSCTSNVGMIECMLPHLAKGAMSSSIRVAVNAPSTAGRYTGTGTITLSPSINDPFPENNSVNVETIVVELPPTGPSYFIYLPLVLNNAP